MSNLLVLTYKTFSQISPQTSLNRHWNRLCVALMFGLQGKKWEQMLFRQSGCLFPHSFSNVIFTDSKKMSNQRLANAFELIYRVSSGELTQKVVQREDDHGIKPLSYSQTALVVSNSIYIWACIFIQYTYLKASQISQFNCQFLLKINE